jgi:neutral ceramidase
VITIAGLANSYTHYVVTFEEYQAQRYEAASTLYGPYTLDAYLQEFRRIVQDLLNDWPSASDEPPKDLSRRQVSLLGPVELDVIAPGHNFGEVVKDAEDSYSNNGTETAQVVFRSANPRNNQRIQGTFLSVDYLSEHGKWKTIYTDGDWVTRYYWKGGTPTSFGMSYAEIHWNIPEGAAQGLYRICHFGSHFTLWGDAKAWAYYSPEWMNPFGSIGVHILNQSIRLAVALSESFRSFLGMEGNYRMKEFEGCSKTFLVYNA